MSTVIAYQEAFEKLSHKVDYLPENFLIGCFSAGLRDDVRLDVKIKQPRTLADAIGVARLIKEKNNLQKKNMGGLNNKYNQPKTNFVTGLLGPPPSKDENPSPFKRLTSQEARERREKGLCYYCDEKFSRVIDAKDLKCS